MNCDETVGLIQSAEDGGMLGDLALPISAVEHLAGCVSCRAERDGELAARKRLAAFRSVDAPPSLRSRIAEALDAAQRDVSPEQLKEKTGMSERLDEFWNRLRYGGALGGRFTVPAFVGAVALALLLIAPFLLRQPHGGSMAFADVESALDHVATVHWISHSTQYDSAGQVVREIGQDNCARLSPPALSRTVIGGDRVRSVETADGLTSYDPVANTVKETKMPKDIPAGLPLPSVKANIEHTITLDDTDSVFISMPLREGEKQIVEHEAPSVAELTPFWTSKNASLDGKAVTEFDRTVVLPNGESYKQYVLVDPASKLVQKSGFWLFTTDGKLSADGVNDHFIYNSPIPDDEFTIKPAPNAKVTVESPHFVISQVTRNADGSGADKTLEKTVTVNPDGTQSVKTTVSGQ